MRTSGRKRVATEKAAAAAEEAKRRASSSSRRRQPNKRVRIAAPSESGAAPAAADPPSEVTSAAGASSSRHRPKSEAPRTAAASLRSPSRGQAMHSARAIRLGGRSSPGRACSLPHLPLQLWREVAGKIRLRRSPGERQRGSRERHVARVAAIHAAQATLMRCQRR